MNERYDDSENRRIYVMSRDVEGRWLDLHYQTTGAGKPIDQADCETDNAARDSPPTIP